MNVFWPNGSALTSALWHEHASILVFAEKTATIVEMTQVVQGDRSDMSFFDPGQYVPLKRSRSAVPPLTVLQRFTLIC